MTTIGANRNWHIQQRISTEVNHVENLIQTGL